MRRTIERKCANPASVAAAIVLLLAGPVAAQSTTRMSVDSAGVEGNQFSGHPSISADGRCVSFTSLADNLAPGADINNTDDVFVHDRQTGLTTRVSLDSAGTGGDSYSDSPSISADGRYVAFRS